MAGFSVTQRLIHSVYISREFRGMHIGETLMKKLLADAGNADPVIVFVAEKNIRAIAFYRRLGFQDTQRRVPWTFSQEFSMTEVEMCLTGTSSP